MSILIGKSLQKSNIMKTWTYIIDLDIKGNHKFKLFAIYTLQKYLPSRELTLINLNFRKKGIITS